MVQAPGVASGNEGVWEFWCGVGTPGNWPHVSWLDRCDEWGKWSRPRIGRLQGSLGAMDDRECKIGVLEILQVIPACEGRGE